MEIVTDPLPHTSATQREDQDNSRALQLLYHILTTLKALKLP